MPAGLAGGRLGTGERWGGWGGLARELSTNSATVSGGVQAGALAVALSRREAKDLYSVMVCSRVRGTYGSAALATDLPALIPEHLRGVRLRDLWVYAQFNPERLLLLSLGISGVYPETEQELREYKGFSAAL